MNEHDRIMKLMDYAKTLGIYITNWEMPRDFQHRTIGVLGGGICEEGLGRMETIINMSACLFEIPKISLIHIGNFNGKCNR